MGNPLEEQVDVEVGDEQFRHNWLYSVVPATVENGDLAIFLSGYDRVCQRAFTVRLPIDNADGYVAIRQLDIPRWGCVNPDEALGS